MASSYAPRRLSFDLLLVVRLVLLSILLTRVNAHGWITQPPSRQEGCRAGTVDAQYCDNVQYEPQSVEALKGAPFTRDVGDHICNGGSDRFDALNTAGPGFWPNTTIQAGSDLTLQWKLTVAHKTTNYQYYLTKPGWSASSAQRLTKDDFEETPVALIDGNNTAPPLAFAHTITGSAFNGRSGYAVVYAVWEIADTKNSFYSCVDLYIAGSNAASSVAATPTSTMISARSSATSASSTLANSLITSTTSLAVSTTSVPANATTTSLLNAAAVPTSDSTTNHTINSSFNGTISGTVTNGTITNGTITGTINGASNSTLNGTISGTITNGTLNGTITGSVVEAERKRLARSVQGRRRRASR